VRRHPDDHSKDDQGDHDRGYEGEAPSSDLCIALRRTASSHARWSHRRRSRATVSSCCLRRRGLTGLLPSQAKSP
jgi:hypothetical protein